jgi:hypothetical protein
MEFINKFISVEKYIGSGEQPVYLMDYSGRYVYTTLMSSAHESNTVWSHTQIGDKVRIPIFGYKTGKKPTSGMFPCGMQIGMQALEHYQQHSDDKRLTDLQHVLLVVGLECHDLSPLNADRVYVGISFAREK